MSDTEMTENPNTLIRKDLGVKAPIDNFINLLEQAEKLAKYVANSNTFGNAFKDEDGKIVEGDIISAIMLGNELGIPPMSAITLGKRLNANAYFKAMKGKALGLDPISSQAAISIIPTQNGEVVHTGVSVITKVLLDNKVQFEFTEDYVPIYKYYNVKTKLEIDAEKHKDNLYTIDAETTEKELTDAKNEGLILCTKRLFTRRTTVHFERPSFKPVTISYTLQDATDAGLYRGTTGEGEQVDGKANWNYHPATMLRNRALTIGGRIICGDKLMSVYSDEEASEFTNFNYVHED